MNKFQRLGKGGFTLVELLVVIAIIALLLAILMPSLNRAKFFARLKVCASNEHQIGLGMGSYAANYKGLMPRFDLDGTGNNLWDVARGHVDVMVKQYNVPLQSFFCPSGWQGWMWPGVNNNGYEQYGYFYLIGYMLWTPRLNGGRPSPPDYGIVPGELIRGPKGYYDTPAMRNPIFTDLTCTDLTSNYNIDLSVSGTTSTLWSTSQHQENGNLTWTNQTFVDGSTVSIRGSQVKCRYGGNYWDWR